MKRGFTLIELLVVVLIIGILAAIALPMYTRTVERTRLSEAVMQVSAIANSMERYILEHGYPAEAIYEEDVINALDIKLPKGTWKDDTFYATKNFYYSFGIYPDSVQIDVYRTKGDMEPLQLTYYAPRNAVPEKYCAASEEKYNYLCEGLKNSGYSCASCDP